MGTTAHGPLSFLLLHQEAGRKVWEQTPKAAPEGAGPVGCAEQQRHLLAEPARRGPGSCWAGLAVCGWSRPLRPLRLLTLLTQHCTEGAQAGQAERVG